MEDMEKMEQNKSSKPVAISPNMTLQKAVDFGEYDPEYLATFPEWHTLSRQIQWQMIKKALDVRERQLLQQWAEINNVIDFRLKPHLQEALDNVWKQKKKVQDDKERLLLKYSTM
jgi:hypothetical protein